MTIQFLPTGNLTTHDCHGRQCDIHTHTRAALHVPYIQYCVHYSLYRLDIKYQTISGNLLNRVAQDSLDRLHIEKNKQNYSRLKAHPQDLSLQAVAVVVVAVVYNVWILVHNHKQTIYDSL